jgi:hypothetical protein
MYQYTSAFRGRSVPVTHRVMYLFRALLNSHVCFSYLKSLVGKNPTNSKRVIRFLNDITNGTHGKGLDWLNLIIIRMRRSETASFDLFERIKLTDCGMSVDAVQYADMLRGLETEGVIKISGFLSKADASELGQQIRLIPGRTKSVEFEWNNLDDWLNSNDSSPRFDTRVDLLLNLPMIHRISQNNLLQKIARDYIGVPPLIVDIQSWTTAVKRNLSEQVLEESAMALHCDSDYVKFIKIFLLLTDVDINNGPFQFVQKSHRGRRHVAGRMPDSEIVTSSDTLFNGTGEAGDLLIVDTRGWHKATPVNNGHRTMVQLIYTSSYFGGQVA